MKKAYPFFIPSVLFLICMMLSPLLQSATSLSKNSSYTNSGFYQPWLEYEFKLGSQGYFNRLGLLIPIKQSMNQLWYLTMINKLDHLKSLEGNFGLGYRLASEQTIKGAYLFYDAKTLHHHRFQQFTLGAELLYNHVELRGNIYLPFHTGSYKNALIQPLNTRVALAGFDIEVGSALPWYKQLSSHIAYYHFGHHAQHMHGFRNRTSFQWNDMVSLEGQASFDRARGLQIFTGIKLRYAIGSTEPTQVSWQQKMTLLPVRDLDIVTAIKELPSTKGSASNQASPALSTEPPSLPSRSSKDHHLIEQNNQIDSTLTLPPLPPRDHTDRIGANCPSDPIRPPALPPRADKSEVEPSAQPNAIPMPPPLPSELNHPPNRAHQSTSSELIEHKSNAQSETTSTPSLSTLMDRENKPTLPTSLPTGNNANEAPVGQPLVSDYLRETLAKRRQAIANEYKEVSANPSATLNSSSDLSPTSTIASKQNSDIPTPPPLPNHNPVSTKQQTGQTSQTLLPSLQKVKDTLKQVTPKENTTKPYCPEVLNSLQDLIDKKINFIHDPNEIYPESIQLNDEWQDH